tara:strand:+ start:52 stop:318 length:267 start_codon:yes stop_codon:yes gene_type:complete
MLNKNKKKGDVMMLVNTVRFKFEFNSCKTYSNIFNHLKSLEKLFKVFKKLGVKKDGGEDDDYHNFYIETSDKKIINKLKKLGFRKEDA